MLELGYDDAVEATEDVGDTGAASSSRITEPSLAFLALFAEDCFPDWALLEVAEVLRLRCTFQGSSWIKMGSGRGAVAAAGLGEVERC